MTLMLIVGDFSDLHLKTLYATGDKISDETLFTMFYENIQKYKGLPFNWFDQVYDSLNPQEQSNLKKSGCLLDTGETRLKHMLELQAETGLQVFRIRMGL